MDAIVYMAREMPYGVCVCVYLCGVYIVESDLDPRLNLRLWQIECSSIHLYMLLVSTTFENIYAFIYLKLMCIRQLRKKKNMISFLIKDIF